MENVKRYTWTITIIAVVDRDELVENEAVQAEAYKEFEDAITSQKHPDKDIKFSIYQYDVKDKMAYIRVSKVRNKRYQLKEKACMQVPDFYGNDYQHLISFFRQYVAKTSLEKNEEHKHLFIVWGHAAGLGFYKEKIEETLSAIHRKGEFGNPMDDAIRQTAENIYTYNFLRAQLSLQPAAIPYDTLVGSLFTQQKMAPAMVHLPDDDYKALVETMKIISAAQLRHIIAEGLKEDVVSVCTKADGTVVKGTKIQMMLCLSCYVNMLETIFALKDIVHVYVAPQTMISHYGYNYRTLFKLLTEKPGATEKEIAVDLVSYYLVKYATSPLAEKVKNNFMIAGLNYKDTVSFSVSYLTEMDNAVRRVQHFTELIGEVEKKAPRLHPCLDMDIKKAMLNAIDKCKPTSKGGVKPTGILDYENFITEIFIQIHRSIQDFLPGKYYLGYHIIASYFPGPLARYEYDISSHSFLSQSPGSFSIFLPGQNLSPTEGSLMEIYVCDEGIRLFLEKTGWAYIINMLLDENMSTC